MAIRGGNPLAATDGNEHVLGRKEGRKEGQRGWLLHFFHLHELIGDGMRPIVEDDATPTSPDPDDPVARLQAQIDAAKARRAGYRAQAAETVARGGPMRPTDEQLGIIRTDDTVGRIAADAGQEIQSRLSRLTSRLVRRRKT